MDRVIYDSQVHSFLYNRYVEQLGIQGIDFGKLFNELNFFVERKYMERIPDPEFLEVRYPEISQEWLSGYRQHDLFMQLLEKNNNPTVQYNYSFTLLDRRIFSCFYYWFLSAVDAEARSLVDVYFRELEHTIAFVANNTPNKASWNRYLDLWIGILKNVREINDTYRINGVRFGSLLNSEEYDHLLMLLAGNKR